VSTDYCGPSGKIRINAQESGAHVILDGGEANNGPFSSANMDTERVYKPAFKTPNPSPSKMRILPLSGIVTALSTSFFTPPTNPGDCFTLSTTLTLENLIECFDGFTVPANAYTVTAYATAQPTLEESNAWMRTVGSMLSVDNNCLSVDRTGIASDYAVRIFTERVSGGRSFCVLSESRTISPGGYYRRGWGLVVVPARRSAIR
jgi:hypothetical protein